MFDFFEGLIEKIGVKLVSDFNIKLIDFIKETKKNNNDKSTNFVRIGSSEHSAEIGSSGNFAKIQSLGEHAEIGSSEHYAEIGSSGGFAEIESLGDSAKIGSSGHSANIESSGDYAEIGSSGYSANIESSGVYAKIGSSGHSAEIRSSGHFAKIGSSGNFAKIQSLGEHAKIGSSGNFAEIRSLGEHAEIRSLGEHAEIGSSGNYAEIGSSGHYAEIDSSGHSAKIGSLGNYAKIGSSGHYAEIDSSGDSSIVFACGILSIIKAKKGTWISLAEYGKNDDNEVVPIFAKSAQIGNKEYTDSKGKTLSPKYYYCLYKKEFHIVEEYDGINTIKISEKKRDNRTIIKAINLDDILDKKIKEVYIAKEGGLTAHGNTVREAVEDLTMKKLDNVNTKEIIQKIKESGKVNRSQYRAITGACSYGTNKFCEEHNIQDLDEIELTELRKILIDDYGAEKFWKMIDE